MAELDAPAVAALLAELGRRRALAGANSFQARPYLRTPDSLAAMPEQLARAIKQNRLR